MKRTKYSTEQEDYQLPMGEEIKKARDKQREKDLREVLKWQRATQKWLDDFEEFAISENGSYEKIMGAMKLLVRLDGLLIAQLPVDNISDDNDELTIIHQWLDSSTHFRNWEELIHFDDLAEALRTFKMEVRRMNTK